MSTKKKTPLALNEQRPMKTPNRTTSIALAKFKDQLRAPSETPEGFWILLFSKVDIHPTLFDEFIEERLAKGSAIRDLALVIPEAVGQSAPSEIETLYGRIRTLSTHMVGAIYLVDLKSKSSLMGLYEMVREKGPESPAPRSPAPATEEGIPPASSPPHRCATCLKADKARCCLVLNEPIGLRKDCWAWTDDPTWTEKMRVAVATYCGLLGGKKP